MTVLKVIGHVFCVRVDCGLSVAHLLREDVVGHIHYTVVMVTVAFYFGHHRGFDAGVGHLVCFLVNEDPAVGQRIQLS